MNESDDKKDTVEDEERKLMPPPPPSFDRSVLQVRHQPRKVGFYFPQTLPTVTSSIHKRDYDMVIELHAAYKLLSRMRVIATPPATFHQMNKFHSEDYLNAIESMSQGELDVTDEDLEEYGIDDVEDLEHLWDHMKCIAGASLYAACHLTTKEVDVAINYTGGRHHAKKSEGSGYCYVNDVVLSILHLKSVFPRVLYIDLDAHHGDGVEEAFYYSADVMTLSLHKYKTGFFPQTGSVKNVGKSEGKYYSVNVPLKDGANDITYVPLFRQIFLMCVGAFKPSCIVLQSGADALSGDPVGGLNITTKGFGECVKEILSLRLPTLVLGGGGYNSQNTARCWAYVTSLALGLRLPDDIPEHKFVEKYSPGFQLHINESKRENLNSRQYINELLQEIKTNLEKVKSSSV